MNPTPDTVFSAPPPRRGPAAWLGQAVLYALFAATIGVFSTWPPYRHLADDAALIKLSFSHPGKIIGECRQRSAEELAKIPAHLRAAQDCPRERSPVAVRIVLDGADLYADSLAPRGMSRDGAAVVYQRFPVKAGRHTLGVDINDDVNVKGPMYHRDAELTLEPGRVVLIDFIAEKGGIVIR